MFSANDNMTAHTNLSRGFYPIRVMKSVHAEWGQQLRCIVYVDARNGYEVLYC